MTEQNITDVLVENYMPYSAHVIMDRALPEIDGLKPSQRRILYTMYKMGLLKGGRKKSQSVVGQTMFLHPHGDQSIYETAVKMAKDNMSMSVPYIDSKGNFGKVYSRDMQFASARYTEMKLSDSAKELFRDIDKTAVYIDNYDGTLKEPRLLPTTYPNVLVNASNGMAVGMASTIAPFNINEVIDYTIAYIKDTKTNVADHITAPDFPTGGEVLYNKDTFNKIFETGRGSFVVRATYKLKENSIIFDSVPYNTTFEQVMDKISDLIKDNKVKEITDMHDIDGIHETGIEVVVKKNTDKEGLVRKLFKMTPLQSSFPCNFNLIVDGQPKTLGIKGIIRNWVAFRAETIKRGAQYDLRKKQEKKHLLKAFNAVMLDIDRAIEVIRNTKTTSKVVQVLMEEFSIDDKQAEFVAEIKLRHLNKEYMVDKLNEIEKLDEEIAYLNTLLTDRKELAKVIIDDLERVKKEHGQERVTQVVDESEIEEFVIEENPVEDYNVKVFVTKENYLKKIPLTSLRSAGTQKLKDEDEIISEFDTTNNSEVLVFTDKQNVYKKKTYELEDHKTSVLGEYLPTLFGLKDEKILFVTVTSDHSEHLIIGFDDGKVARIELMAYHTKQNRSMLKNAYANKKALFFDVVSPEENIDLFLVSSIDKALLYSTEGVNVKSSKTTQGVQVMKSKNDSYVKSIVKADASEDLEYYRTKSAGVGKYLK